VAPYRGQEIISIQLVGLVPLTRHAEIVLEIGPYVPPHLSYAFPPGT